MFAERLKELREEKGLSFVRLAEATGLGKTALNYWETGKTDITSDNLVVLAKFFNVSVGYMVGTED
ncbi:MAG: helix-turn-helix domain-containing protein [Firmicutes bacterium]|nr:helix-turn-helix domain-containing protein [Bacillota bacterium]